MSNLETLQTYLINNDIDGFIIPTTDEYLSEFSREPYKRLEWTTKFSGSTGLAIVLRDAAALFVDGRYKLQGEQEVAGLPIEVCDTGDIAQANWLSAHLGTLQKLGVDNSVLSIKEFERLRTIGHRCGITIFDAVDNPVDAVWRDRGDVFDTSKIFDYDVAFAGRSAFEKTAEITTHLREQDVSGHLLCDPEDVAWLLNVRTDDCRDLDRHGWQVLPIPLTRAFVHTNKSVTWFVNRARLTPELLGRIEADGIMLREPNSFGAFLRELPSGRYSANFARTPERFAELLRCVGKLTDDAVVAHCRWRKSPEEITAARNGHDKDGLATIKFLAWLHESIGSKRISEIDAAVKLREFRSEDPAYRGPSMPFMSAAGPSAAMPHYVPSEKNQRLLNDHSIYLIDSGCQYLGCSTDNTICTALSTPTAEVVLAHTLVIKGWIAFASAIFPVGTTSVQIDAIARQPLWNAGRDYRHGTGHGVGNFMNIHEGPHVRSQFNHPMIAEICQGMILANEPGLYQDGVYGVRVESHMAVVRGPFEGFLSFDTLSSLPIDPNLIDSSLLTTGEVKWLQEYNRALWSRYEERLDPRSRAWLTGVVKKFEVMRAE